MLELLHRLSDWIAGFADSPWAVAILAIDSFTESIINPIPPDPLLIAIAIGNPRNALWLAALVTATSVLGALIGHWLGLHFGRPIVLRFFSEVKIAKVEQMFQKYGAWAVLLAAFTPIPYKVFTVTAGVMEMERRPFIIASIIGRGARFFILGILIFAFGEAIQGFIETQFEVLTVVSSIVLIAAAAAAYFIMRYRKARRTVVLQEGQSVEGSD
jgi:membrane protein YqaA with SNARE-associated domain